MLSSHHGWLCDSNQDLPTLACPAFTCRLLTRYDWGFLVFSKSGMVSGQSLALALQGSFVPSSRWLARVRVTITAQQHWEVKTGPDGVKPESSAHQHHAHITSHPVLTCLGRQRQSSWFDSSSQSCQVQTPESPLILRICWRGWALSSWQLHQHSTLWIRVDPNT
jgi:hypothetical protein